MFSHSLSLSISFTLSLDSLDHSLVNKIFPIIVHLCRAQARSQNVYRGTNMNQTTLTTAAAAATNEPEPPNLTNPKRVKKLTKFFGEDPPLMRLFLKRLGYEVMYNCEYCQLSHSPHTHTMHTINH